MTDQEIRERLKALDDRGDVDMGTWESGFLERVLFTSPTISQFGPHKGGEATFPLTPKQRQKAL